MRTIRCDRQVAWLTKGQSLGAGVLAGERVDHARHASGGAAAHIQLVALVASPVRCGPSAGGGDQGLDHDLPGRLVVDVFEHVHVRRSTVRDVATIHDRHAGRVRSGGLDRDVAFRGLEQVRMREGQDREWVMQGRTPDVVVAADVVRGEEAEELGDHVRERRVDGGDLLDSLRGHQQLMRDVESGHGDVGARAEHDRRRLGVGPDVELGERCSVAERAAAHEGDSGDVVEEVGRGTDREGDVGERAGRHQPEARRFAAHIDDEADGVGTVGATVRHGKIRAVQPALAVHEPRELGFGDERSFSSGVHRDVEIESVTNDAGVVGGAFEWCVAGDRRDAGEVGAVRRHDDGDDIVVTRIAVEDDPRAPGGIDRHDDQHRMPRATMAP